MMARIAVSLVTYNSAAVIVDCLRSLPDHVDIYIQDNNSSDTTLDSVRRERPQAHIRHLRHNIGFGRAHNKTFRETDHDFVLVLNPDTILLPGCLDHLIETAKIYPQAGVIGALHQQHDGAVNACFRNDLDYYPQIIGEPSLYKAKAAGKATPEAPVCVEQMTGALMLFRRSALDKIKGFDRRLFMYFEDDDICARLRLNGFNVILCPMARVVHFEGKSAGGSSRVACIKGYQFERSRKIIYAIYHGRDGGFLKLVLGGTLRCLRRVLRYTLKNDRNRTLYYLAGIAGLWSGLPDFAPAISANVMSNARSDSQYS